MTPSPSHRRRSGTIVSSPLGGGRRRSGHRLSIMCISKPAKSSNSNVKVCIRMRPISEKEQSFREGKEVIDLVDDNTLLFDPVEVHTPSFHRGRPMRDPTAKRNRDLKFTFGRVFGPYSNNQQIFEETTQATLDCLMKGINCSVFAYGSTGAGKTFTMLGTPENKGVIARTVHALYERIESIRDTTDCDVEVSYLEIYNETARDLLKPTGQELVLRESSNGVVVAGLSFHKPATIEELFEMLEFGNSNRTQHPTDANKESSRSHAVFHIYLKQKPRTADVSTDIVMSKMALIDLAGSERAAATANCGARFREGANINKSLLALGNCINALADGKRNQHIPYRDSKLTRILKDSLGGNCQTVMIAAVSSSAMAYDDTYNTLKYADRAQKIKLDLKTNVYRVDRPMHEYGKIVEQLLSEVQELKQKIESLEMDKRRLKMELDASRQQRAFVADMAVEAALAPADGAWTSKQINDLTEIVSLYVQMQSNLLEAESQRGLVQLKLAQRERSQNQLSEVQWDAEKKQLTQCRRDKFRINSQSRIDQLTSQISRHEDALRDMKRSVDDAFKQAIGENGNSTSNINQIILDAMKDRSDVCQLKASDRHLRAMVDCLNMRMDQQDRVIEAMGSLLKEQHLLLQSYHYLTPSFIARFESVEKVLESGKEVSWSDQNGNALTTAPKVLELPDCTIRKFGFRDASYCVQNPVNGHVALATTAPAAAPLPSTVAHSILSNAADRTVDFSIKELPRPPLRARENHMDDVQNPRFQSASSSEEDEEYQTTVQLPATPPKSVRHNLFSAKPKGTPFRKPSLSSDDGENISDGEHTFILGDNMRSGRATTIGIVKSDVVTGQVDADNRDGHCKFSPSAVRKFVFNGPEFGRPSLPASKAQLLFSSKAQDVDADGFKKPPIPERFTSKPKPSKATDGAASAVRPKPANENSVISKKPSVTSVRNSPLMRSPSQSSLMGTKKTPEVPAASGGGSGMGLRRQGGSMRNLWRY